MTGNDLSRFLEAQEPVLEQVTAELRAGRKRSHWMWFVFPQIDGLGRSATARFYTINGDVALSLAVILIRSPLLIVAESGL